MAFTDDDLEMLRDVINNKEAHPINQYSIFLNGLLARLLNAENAIIHHGEDDCESCQKWRESCGRPKNKNG